MRELAATLRGKLINCAIWIPDDYGGWKCGAYARRCEVPTCADAPDPKVKQVKVCVKDQKVFSLFYDKKVTRCKKYKTACEGRACMDDPMPYPREASEKVRPKPSEVRLIAEWMAEEANQEAFDREPYLAREILERGGIAPPRGVSAEKEEYKSIPLFLRNRAGLPCDEMAAEMNYDYCDDLRQAIAKEYPIKAKGEWKKKRRRTWEEFQDAAYDMIEDEMAQGAWQ